MTMEYMYFLWAFSAVMLIAIIYNVIKLRQEERETAEADRLVGA